MLVGFGQTICRPVGPKCYICDINKLCPFKDKTKEPSSKTKSKSKKVKAEIESDTTETLSEISEESFVKPKNARSKSAKVTTKK